MSLLDILAHWFMNFILERRKVNRTLPRSHPVEHLYEMTISEDFYTDNVGQITTELCNPDITGIYETQVPEEFRIITKLGCVCSVTSRHKKAHSHRVGFVTEFSFR